MSIMFAKTAEFFAALAHTASGTATAQAAAAGEKLVSEFWARVCGRTPGFEAIDPLCAKDFILTTEDGKFAGRSAFKEWIREFRDRIPGMRLVSHDLFTSADGSRVFSRWTFAGFDRLDPNLPREYSGNTIWEIQGGKLAGYQVERSTLEMKPRPRLPIQPITTSSIIKLK